MTGLQHQKFSYVVGTTGLGLGLDLPAISTVVHWEGAFSIIDIAQQAARAGRNGRSDTSWFLVTSQEKEQIIIKNRGQHLAS